MMQNFSFVRTTTLALLLLVCQGAATSSVGTLSVPPSELKNYPAVVEQGLLQSLMKADINGVNVFSPIYIQTNSETDFLVVWAFALQVKFECHYDKAIRLYRKLLARYPDIDFIRITGISLNSRSRMEKWGCFLNKRLYLGRKSVGWRLSAVQTWIKGEWKPEFCVK